jgi:hypothetical protein
LFAIPGKAQTQNPVSTPPAQAEPTPAADDANETQLGQFEFQQRKRLGSFWGSALVNAYLRDLSSVEAIC